MSHQKPAARIPDGSFGQLLKYLRIRARFTQRDLALAVGYSVSQISRLEHDLRPPGSVTLAARFLPALALENEPDLAAQFLRLAAAARGEPASEAEPANPAAPARPKGTTAPWVMAAVGQWPVWLTSFVGREQEIAEVHHLLLSTRLLTLTGTGGVGKTRLAVVAAEALRGEYPDGVWMIELAALGEPGLVAERVAVGLGLRGESGRPILETITEALHSRRALLLLDNCEHLLDACRRLADILLRQCPQLCLLATSRAPLGITGEAVYRVPPLTVPNPDQPPTPAGVNASLAVRLFVDRARLVVPDYQVHERNAAPLARIAQRLDGIPLALELAAARLQLLTAQELADRLDNVFDLLTHGSAAALPKHQTLRATIDWSYDLLGPAERRLLQRLSVFAGGWTLEAAEAVCAGAGTPPARVLDGLSSLAAKSLLVADRRPGEATRYRLLEMVRQYAQAKLPRGARAALDRRHRDYFRGYAEANVPKLRSNDRRYWLKVFGVERDNMRAALEWSFSRDEDVEAGPRLVNRLCSDWPYSWQEQLDWCERAVAWGLDHPAVGLAVSAELLGYASALAAVNNLPLAVERAEQAVAFYRHLGQPATVSLMQALIRLGRTVGSDGYHDADRSQAAFDEAEALFDRLPPDQPPGLQRASLRASLLQGKAEIALMRGAPRTALPWLLESIANFDLAGDVPGSFNAHNFAGQACLKLSQFEQAQTHFLADLALANELDHHWSRSIAYRGLGRTEYLRGKMDEARDHFTAMVREAYLMPDRNMIAWGLELLAATTAQQGEELRAACLAGAAQVLLRTQGRESRVGFSLNAAWPDGQDRSDAAEIQAAFKAGRAMSLEAAVAYALDKARGA